MSRSRVIFVGNLPFDHTEEQLIEVFRTVGPVVSFRLVFDHQTHKPKGFGFCEYRDAETAASALRNLQGVDVGGRQLRLDFADTDDAGGGKRTGQAKVLPQGVDVPYGTAVDSITKTLANLPPSQLLDVITQVKALVATSPAEARTLLAANPQLTYALFQAMLLIGVVDQSVLQRIMPPTAQPSYSNRPPPAQPGYSNYERDSYGGAPQPAAAPPPAAAPAQDQTALINQVMSMTQAQIDILAPEHRDTIMKIRAQVMASQGRR